MAWPKCAWSRSSLVLACGGGVAPPAGGSRGGRWVGGALLDQGVGRGDGIRQRLLRILAIEQRLLDLGEDDGVDVGLLGDGGDDVRELGDDVLRDRLRAVLDGDRRGREER